MKRPVLVQGNEDALGSWSMASAECPKWKHQDALGQSREVCVSGIATNVQGAIPLKWCNKADRGTNFDPKDMVVECSMLT